MSKVLYITEKPSQAQDYIKSLHLKGERKDGYFESESTVITWCIGHLITMSYPEKYDASLKTWSEETLPFIPDAYKYEVIPSVSKQYKIVKKLFGRSDISTIYWAGDSGREGQYIEELLIMMCRKELNGKVQKRIWIDSTTEDEIKRGIAQAKDMAAYFNLGQAGFLRAIEDYLMGINFSRIVTLKYEKYLKTALNTQRFVVAVGRVMSCVLAMVVERERDIKNFVETTYYGIKAYTERSQSSLSLDWKAVKGTAYYGSDLLFSDNGFRNKADAESLIDQLPASGVIYSIAQKKEHKQAPLLYNLAELQNECSKKLKISPDQTLTVVQSLYEKKLVTYPRTDARVLSSAVAAEIKKNLHGLTQLEDIKEYAEYAVTHCADLTKTKYVDDSKITDHYAIIPTGQILTNDDLNDLQRNVYDLIVKRFLSIFFPAAEYAKLQLVVQIGKEFFFYNNRTLTAKGYLVLYTENDAKEEADTDMADISQWKKGDVIRIGKMEPVEKKTTPPKRYTSGSMILAMENAGNLIEEEELREQMKGSGIGTSATRASIIKKLQDIDYIALNKKTQVLTPKAAGELVYNALQYSMPQILNPLLTASWELGLSRVEDGSVSRDEYMKKISDFIVKLTNSVKALPADDDSVAGLFGISAEDMKEREYDCPLCKSSLVSHSWGYRCSNENCKFKLNTFVAGKNIPNDEVENLLVHGKTSFISGFQSKKKKSYSARLLLDESGNIKFDFQDDSLKCPYCGSTLKSFAWGFACQNDNCGFSLSKIIAKKQLSDNQIKMLLKDKKTNVISGFKTNKNGTETTFKAKLGLKDKKVIFLK